MTLLRRLYGQLKLKINESKSAVSSAYERKFLGYAFWAGLGQQTKRTAATKAIATYKQRIRQLTRRSAGLSMQEVIEKLRQHVLGWKAYFGMAQTPSVFKRLDEWMRHRLRAIQLKHWRCGVTMYRELKALRANHQLATPLDMAQAKVKLAELRMKQMDYLLTANKSHLKMLELTGDLNVKNAVGRLMAIGG